MGKLSKANPITLTALLILATALGETSQIRRPLEPDFRESTTYRWLKKPVLQSLSLDEMESLDHWELENSQQAKGEMGLSSSPVHGGNSSLRLSCPTKGEKPLPRDRYFGFARLVRKVDDADWSDWNRISFWVFPDMPGFKNISLLIILHNDGEQKVPDRYGKMGLNYLLLRNREWNHIVWEIANLPRDRVTGFEFQYRMQGNEPGATDLALFYFDDLDLQNVEPDYYEGWEVAPGRIAYSHLGYLPGLRKEAFSLPVNVEAFQIINETSGQTELKAPVRHRDTPNGSFAIYDFSNFQKPGRYRIEAGELVSRTFSIGEDVWDRSIWAILNFFYTERCGTRIPGIHDVCHRDWVGKRGKQKIVINGGWHDAGDLSQGLKNTSEGTVALFSLAEYLTDESSRWNLRERLIEEARWGLEWVMKTRFADGSRVTWATHDRWSNGIIGDVDDMEADAYQSPSANFRAATAESIGSRILEEIDPEFSSLALKEAVMDWEFGVAFLKKSAGWKENDVELVSLSALAALQLFRTTGQEKFADWAITCADNLLESQQQKFLPGLHYPITGFFYENPTKERILRSEHSSNQQAPLLALAELCRLFPRHSKWMEWYAALTFYSRFYLEEMSHFSAPYNMLASAFHRRDDHSRIEGAGLFPGANAVEFEEQVQNGIRVGEGFYVRRFPVWFVFRGNNGTLLSDTVGLGAAGRLRNSVSALQLAQEQLMWVIGRNPFSESTIFGVGYDYPPQYAAMLGDQVGATAVGIQTRHERDIPYWPVENCHNWKETWLHPAIRWLELMPYLMGGRPEPSSTQVMSQSTNREGRVTVLLSLPGQGNPRLQFLAENLEVYEKQPTGSSNRPGEFLLRGRMTNIDEPWILLIIPDEIDEGTIELTGSVPFPR